VTLQLLGMALTFNHSLNLHDAAVYISLVDWLSGLTTAVIMILFCHVWISQLFGIFMTRPVRVITLAASSGKHNTTIFCLSVPSAC